MKKVIVKLTVAEFQNIEESARRLNLRGPEEWLRLAGLNFKLSMLGSETSEIEAKKVISNLQVDFFKTISERLLDAYSNYRVELKKSASEVAKIYLREKRQFTAPEIRESWKSDLLDPDFFMRFIEFLAHLPCARERGQASWEKGKERWPFRISYGGLKQWLASQNVQVELKKAHPKSLFLFLDFVRDVWVHFGASLKTDHDFLATIDGVEFPGPHLLTVRADNGQPGNGAFVPSPLLKQHNLK